jgi:hypothetical protein
LVEWALGLVSVIAISLISLGGIAVFWVADKKLKKAFVYMVSFALYLKSLVKRVFQ